MIDVNTFLDPDRMKDVFQKHLPGFSEEKIKIRGCEILHTRHRFLPLENTQGKPCLCVHYALELLDSQRRKRGRQMIYAKAYQNGRSLKKFKRVDPERLFSPRFGEALVHLPELGLLVWAFPNDLKLPRLPEIADSEKVRQYLPYQSLPTGLAQQKDITEIKIEVIRHKPETRCTFRYQIYGKGTKQPVTIYGKMFRYNLAKAVYHRMDILWKRSKDPACFSVPQPLGYCEKIKTVWQAEMPGKPLPGELSLDNCQKFMKTAAIGLVGLHKTSLPVSTKKRPVDHLTKIHGKLAELARAYPRLEKPLKFLLLHLENTQPKADSFSETLIHGDFIVRQIVVHRDRLGVFDYDDFALGDPLEDVAVFMVDLYFHGFTSKAAGLMGDMFFAAYQAHADWKAPVHRLNWHLGVQFIIKAYYFYKRKKSDPDFEKRLEELIRLASRAVMS